ncbi:MAG: zinc ribbon domain-containing protein [Deltaproteobacteria bacterium]|nr:zinc ribbon domain-containing protein [Deltaproteobacteria bacterium]MBT6435929.1 zinc ribbon domain-containing protein [Deltaproteobacteria bacterium]MBT6491465.1 zinc ribbon domain-containing protein [Deltaproteobacteria bacterium]
MPMYEYQCGKCGHLWELLQRISDPAPKTCPDCRSRKVGKMLSQTSFVLKGGGWYADGYSGGKKKKEAKASSDSSKSTKPSSSD